jgi:hypothetical protein
MSIHPPPPPPPPQLYHGENKWHSIKWWSCPLDIRQTNCLDLYSASSLKEHSICRHVPTQLGLGLWCLMPLLNNILLISWRSYDEGNRSPQRKPLTCRKPMTNFITWCCIAWAGIRTHNVIGDRYRLYR